jgi:hypothetical protein
MVYYVTIQEEAELQETWIDGSIPNMRFCFQEIELEQCNDLGNGTYEASYETFDVIETSVFHYYDENDILQEYVLQPGEYGIRPNSRRA